MRGFLYFCTKIIAMRLIIDSGSTKMGWILLEGQKVTHHFVTQGFNPNYSEIQCLENLINNTVEPPAFASIQEIHYYGTGCGSEQNCQLIKAAFQRHFPNVRITVTHDLMAACHALFGHEKGIACILGTGSNSCVYDGRRIVERAVSLGYLVGDEGSGMHIGREVVRAYFYGFMPKALSQQFADTFQLELKDFIQRLYHTEQPSKYLASFAKFAGENKSDPFIRHLIKQCFNDFIEVFICRYNVCKSMKISFVGSISFHFQDVLKECMDAYGLMIGEIKATPADGLVRYYSE